jgi:hypothetical protein
MSVPQTSWDNLQLFSSFSKRLPEALFAFTPEAVPYTYGPATPGSRI